MTQDLRSHEFRDGTDRPVPTATEGFQGLTVSRIGKSFRRRPVVRGVSLRLKRGEVVGLLGPNGAGKTTCFYLITGLLRPDSGTISLDGHDITRLPMYRRARLGIGYLPQESSIFRGLTVEQNILPVGGPVAPPPQVPAAAGRRPSRRIRDRASAPRPCPRAVGRRTAPRRDRARAGD